ncbi:precorrin-3B synthase [Gemmobacter serpentinus]|uniref:precorrin-3B synthase n=1 Tax=Gemmobacter serpentinus TaxID=2652247 RepID=UPI00124D45CD|nr:precorrin-3B synthase [Gemmobacter serpentinus]
MADPRDTGQGFTVQGWCPGALRPMESGDGWVVRVRAPLSRLTQDQAMGLAEGARRFGNGRIDLSARANLQLRGVTPATHVALIESLRGLNLLDADARSEGRRNILLSPFADREAQGIAMGLTEALRDWPDNLADLPGKFGFAIDCGPAPLMQGSSADIRLERAETGQLILRADGASLGAPVTARSAPAAMLALAHWFISHGGIQNGRGRMATLIARGARPDAALTGTLAPTRAGQTSGPGPVAGGMLLGLAFGQMRSETLAALADLGPLQLTPWRMLLLEGVTALPDHLAFDDLIRTADPLMQIDACPGAPDCPQALQPTRDLARKLAALIPKGCRLHVSGCAKGCAHPGPADLTLVAQTGGFGLIRHGSARDLPQRLLPPDLKGLF